MPQRPRPPQRAARTRTHERPGSPDRLVSGRLDLHRDGFGFVRTDDALGDIFIPPHEIHAAMSGDTVLVQLDPPSPRDTRRSGRIARVLTRKHPTVVGIFHYARQQSRRSFADAARLPGIHHPRGNYVTPLDERLSDFIAIADGAETLPADSVTPHRTIGTDARTAWEPADSDLPLEGIAVDVEILSYATPTRPAQGRVIEILGPPDAFGVDVEIIIRKHHIPHTFPEPVLAEADARARETVALLNPDELTRREDFRPFPVITIDGETARDFDDAVHVRPLPNGNTELQVHIADVSHYVTAGTPLDTEARLRGTSVYFPDRAVPMLPHALSSGMCSLLPHEDRLVLSCIMEVDPDGEIARYRVAEGIIRSARRCTYTEVQAALDAAQGSGPRVQGQVKETLPGPLAQGPGPFLEMLELAQRLNAKRVRRGSIDFDLPEPVIQFDPDGNMQAIVRSERGWSHRLIEEFMLSANECVATWLRNQGIASIYRIHEVPDPKRILEFEETAAAFGHSLGIGALPVKRFTMKFDRRENQRRADRGRTTRTPQEHELPESIPITPQMYQKLVRRITGTASERILAYLMLRSLKQARYSEQNEGHFALASPCYTHFTSPIRRYPDLIVHRLLRAQLRAGADPNGGPIRSDDPQPWGGVRDWELGVRKTGNWQLENRQSVPRKNTLTASTHNPQPLNPDPLAPEELRDIATESSQAERRAADAERELIEWKKIKFMADKVGDDFPAVILSCTKYGFFVELDDLFIEGLVPLASLPGDHWTFRDTDRTIAGARTGHVFSLGQKVHVILDRIDRRERRLQFALLPGTEPVANTGYMPPRESQRSREGKKPSKRSAKALKSEKKKKKRR